MGGTYLSNSLDASHGIVGFPCKRVIDGNGYVLKNLSDSQLLSGLIPSGVIISWYTIFHSSVEH